MKIQKKQRGMAALSMIMIVVVLLAVIGTVVATSRTSTSTSSESSKLHASSIVDQGNTLRFGIVSMTARGTTTLDAITMDTTATTGLYNGSTGGTMQQTPPKEAFETGSAATTKWIFAKGGSTENKGLVVPQVSAGTSASSYAVVLPNIKDAVCYHINALHHGLALATAAIPAGATAPADANADSILDAQIDWTALVAMNGWNFGCVKTGTTDKNVYFNIVQP